MTTTALTVTPLSNRIGAQIDGVDLTELDDAEFTAIDEALMRYQVVFLRGQELTADSQAAFAGRWGPLSVFPVSKMMGRDTMMSVIEDTVESPPATDTWHTDVTWIAEPPRIAVLYGDIIPPAGGDTMWSSLYAAYEQLSPEMAAICERLLVVHHRGAEFDRITGEIFGAQLIADLEANYPAVVHPLIRTHPVTGKKALFVAGHFMDQIIGMNRAESDLLLGYLQGLIDNPNNQVRWHWQHGDVAIWDEASTNHRALADHYPQHRRMRRCTVDGDRPFYRD